MRRIAFGAILALIFLLIAVSKSNAWEIEYDLGDTIPPSITQSMRDFRVETFIPPCRKVLLFPVFIEGVKYYYNCSWIETQPNYIHTIYTEDEAFIPPEILRIGDSISKALKFSNGRIIIMEDGDKAYVELPSGWNAGYRLDDQSHGREDYNNHNIEFFYKKVVWTNQGWLRPSELNADWIRKVNKGGTEIKYDIGDVLPSGYVKDKRAYKSEPGLPGYEIYPTFYRIDIEGIEYGYSFSHTRGTVSCILAEDSAFIVPEGLKIGDPMIKALRYTNGRVNRAYPIEKIFCQLPSGWIAGYRVSNDPTEDKIPLEHRQIEYFLKTRDNEEQDSISWLYDLLFFVDENTEPYYLGGTDLKYDLFDVYPKSLVDKEPFRMIGVPEKGGGLYLYPFMINGMDVYYNIPSKPGEPANIEFCMSYDNALVIPEGFSPGDDFMSALEFADGVYYYDTGMESVLIKMPSGWIIAGGNDCVPKNLAPGYSGKIRYVFKFTDNRCYKSWINNLYAKKYKGE